MKKTLTLLLLLAGLTLDAQAEPLTWNGFEDHMTWNTSSYYWWQGDAPALYTNGSDVVFGDNGSGEVTLADTFAPASVLVEAGNDYIFSGKGKLAGSMQLTKSGDGTLTINTANEYEGGTIINSGTLEAGNDSAFGTGVIEINGGALDLGQHSLANLVALAGDASIGNGTFNGKITVGDGNTLTLSSSLSGTGSVSLGKKATLDLNQSTLSNSVTLVGSASIGNGTVNSSITVGDWQTLTLCGSLSGTGCISLGDNATLDLDTHTLSKNVSLAGGFASIGNGSINGTLSMGANSKLILIGDLSGTGTISLGYDTTLYLNTHTLHKDVIIDALTDGGVASIGNGTVDGDIIVGEHRYLLVQDTLSGTGSVTLNGYSTMALLRSTLSMDVNVVGEGITIMLGTVNGNISVAAGKGLELSDIDDVTGTITLGEGSSLDLAETESRIHSSVSLSGTKASIGNGTLNGKIYVGEGKTLTLIADLSGTDSITLGEQSTLDLDGKALSKDVTLTGNASVGNGTINGTLSVGANSTLTLIGDLEGTGDISIGTQATLDLNEHSIANNVIVGGNNASVGNGTINGTLSVGANSTLTLIGDLEGTGDISIGTQATLDLNEHSIANNVIVGGNNAGIGNGTIGGNLILAENVSFSWDDPSLQLAGPIILDNRAALDLDNHSISNNVIVDGSNATISNGTITGKVTVAEGKSLFLKNDVALNKAIILDDGASLDMDGVQAKLSSKFTFTGQSATIDNATLIVEGREKVTLTTNLSGSANISLGSDATLDLNHHTLSNSVTLAGDASIGNGTFDGCVTINEDADLTLTGDLDGSGCITFLNNNGRLNLGGHKLSIDIAPTGNLEIGSGTFNGALTVDANNTLYLFDNIFGSGSITLRDNTDLIIGEHSLSSDITVEGNARIVVSFGSLNGNITVNAEKTLTLADSSNGTGSIFLGDNATLDLENNTISRSVSLAGDSANIGNGTINGSVSVDTGKKLTLIGDLSGQGNISLNDDATLNLGQRTLFKGVTLAENYANIGNGTINGNLSVTAGQKLTLIGDLSGTGNITLEQNAALDLGQYTLYKGVTLAGDASIGNGVLDVSISVNANNTLTLLGDLSGTGSISLGDNATLDLGDHSLSNSVTLAGSSAQIGNGKLDVSLSVDNGKSLTLTGNLDGTGTISLGYDTTLYLNNKTLSVDVTLTGDASIGGGEFNGTLEVGAGNTLSLNGDLSGEGSISLGDNATLDLYNHSLSGNVTLTGNAGIGNGEFNGTLSVGTNNTLTLNGELSGTGNVNLEANATLNLNNQTVSRNLTLTGSNATIENGTISGTISLADGVSNTLSADLLQHTDGIDIDIGTCATFNLTDAPNLTLADVTIAANGILGVYKDDTAVEANEGTLAVVGKLTAGADATLNSNLVMGGTDSATSVLDVSASHGNGGLHMGSTVTLTPGNVLLSEADMDAIGELGFMGKYDLFNGVDRLSLDGTTDFLSVLGLADKWVNAGEVFANEQFQNPEREYYLFYSGASQGGAGGNVGTVYLMQIPEPTTGTLSLLALAALASRRRRK